MTAPTTRVRRVEVNSLVTVTTIRVYRVEVSATTTNTVRVYRVEVNSGSDIGKWIYDGAAWLPLTLVGYPDAGVPPTPTPNYGPIGSYVPGSGTSGLWMPTTSTLVGDRTLSTPNIHYVDTVFDGAITIAATGLKFSNCYAKGPAAVATGSAQCIGGLASNGFSLMGAVFEDCLIKPARESLYVNGIFGSGYTLRRCEITRSVDGIGIMGTSATDTLIEGNWIHNGAWFSPDPTHTDNQTHNDGIQFHQQGQGSLITIRYNMIGGLRSQTGAVVDHNASDDWNNSSLMIQQETSSALLYHVGNVDIYGNTLQGGAARVNMAVKFANDLSGVRLGPNQYIRSTWGGGGGYYILRQAAVAAAISPANVYSDTGAAVPIQITG